MKWKLIVAALLALTALFILAGGIQAETVSMMRLRVNAELRGLYADELKGCDQKCIDGYATDWLKTGAQHTAPFDWASATDRQRSEWMNNFILGGIAWAMKKGDEFKALYVANLHREPTAAEWENFWTRPSGYDERNQAYLDLYNASPRLDKWTDDRLFRRKQEYSHGIE